MKHIVSFSGGIGSYMVIKRLLETIPKEDIVVTFCDVKNECVMICTDL